ncbi:MAG: Holliday junction resolvase RuvX [Candidatus Kapabacteria bacterium]|nr:Holliday junction resolvase RuvX [Candidatus Kapabacteria bacterium]
MALDYGQRRIGVAVCDEMHIIVSTRPVINNTPAVIDEVRSLLERERTQVLLVGVPRLHDERSTPIIQEIEQFIVNVRAALAIPVFEIDEAFSTKEARQIMLRSGMRQKKRQAKGVKDQVAAAVMLESVLEEVRSLRPEERP